MPENTTKLAIIDILRGDGYDFVTAAEEADRVIREFQESGRPAATYYSRGGSAFTLKVKDERIGKVERPGPSPGGRDPGQETEPAG